MNAVPGPQSNLYAINLWAELTHLMNLRQFRGSANMPSALQLNSLLLLLSAGADVVLGALVVVVVLVGRLVELVGRLLGTTRAVVGLLVVVVVVDVGRAGFGSSSTSRPGVTGDTGRRDVLAGGCTAGRAVDEGGAGGGGRGGRAVLAGAGCSGCSLPASTRLMVLSSGYFSLWHVPWKSSVSMLHIIMPPKPIDLANCAFSAKLCMSS